jgi:hypothetical protein
MFLPDYLSQGFANATIEQDGTAAPLVGERQVIFQNTPSADATGFAFTPVVFGWLLFFVALVTTALDFRRNKRSRTFDVFFFLVTGLLGILLFLLWTATDHQAAANNFNLLWALPTHVIAAAYLGRSRLPAWLAKYMLVSVVLVGILLLLWFVWPQQLHTAVFPIALALGLRAAYTVWASRTTVSSPTNQKIKEKI